MRLFFAVVCAIILLAVGSLLFIRRGAPMPASNKLQVVASIFPLADWLGEVGGDDVDVHLLVARNANPHHFEPQVQDAVRVSRARAFFAIGLGLDPWAARLAQNSGRGAELAFFETGTWITPQHLDLAQDNVVLEKGVYGAVHDANVPAQADPHYWLDPQRAASVVRRMAQALAKLDPGHAAGYSSRAEAYAQKLKGLDEQIEAARKTIPPGQPVVTFHNAYGYLLERLGLKLAAVVQVSPGVEPNARDTVNAVRIMRQIGQGTVFREPLGSRDAAEVLARELNGRVAVLDPMDTESGEFGITYLEREAHNIRLLAETFGKQAVR